MSITRQQIVNKRKKVNMEAKNEILKDLLRNINSYNGYFEEERAYYWEEDFFDTFFNSKEEVARATFFGNIQNWTDEYIRFNGYGNLESLNEYQYEKEIEGLESEIVEQAEELQNEDGYIKELLDKYKKERN